MNTQALRRYAVIHLEVGMFISSADIPLCKTPFPLQGFYINNKADISKLALYCNYAMVNMRKRRVMQHCHNVLQLEVQDMPAVFTGRSCIRQSLKQRKPMRPRRQGRVKRLFLLMFASMFVMTIYPTLLKLF